MNGIDRRGQKVVCVVAMEIIDNRDLNPTKDGVPQLGGVYTVSDFLLTGNVVGDRFVPLDSHGPGITLAEIPTVTCDCCGKAMGWPILAFRPVDERKTDISDLVKAGKDAEVMKPIEAPALDAALHGLAQEIARQIARAFVVPYLLGRIR